MDPIEREPLGPVADPTAAEVDATAHVEVPLRISTLHFVEVP